MKNVSSAALVIDALRVKLATIIKGGGLIYNRTANALIGLCKLDMCDTHRPIRPLAFRILTIDVYYLG